MNTEKKQRLTNEEIIDRIIVLAKAFYAPWHELYLGIRTNSLPWSRCFLFGAIVAVLITRHWDYRLFERLHVAFLYPFQTGLYWTYFAVAVLSGFWLWGAYQSGKKRTLKKNLADTFLNAGLKTPMGRLPGYVFDRPIDGKTRKLRLLRAGLPLKAFQTARAVLESDLEVFIDELREDRSNGTLDIIYSHYEMHKTVELEEVPKTEPWTILIGKTRSKDITVSLLRVPHFLVAGQTGGGKSTFIVQAVATLYAGHRDISFTIIDLKNGMEFSSFASLKRVKFISDMKRAVTAFTTLERLLNDRMDVYRENNCKDIDAFRALPKEKRKIPEGANERKYTTRRVLVIDEAAEMFLAGDHAQTGQIQSARRIASKLARLGRSVGLHLIVATQRPDARALDPQVKANLPGILCFQMVNDASSMVVLGNGRATDLSPIPGRGIWKNGFEMVEVQTPIFRDPGLILNYLKSLDDGSAQDVMVDDEDVLPTTAKDSR